MKLFVGPMREKSKYFRIKRSARGFVFKLFTPTLYIHIYECIHTYIHTYIHVGNRYVYMFMNIYVYIYM